LKPLITSGFLFSTRRRQLMYFCIGEISIMAEEIINRIAESGLITLDLEDYYPKEEIAVFDLKDHLFMGMILKEKDFREALKNLDWQVYRGKYVAVGCTADAIIPVWAYMLVASYLQPVANEFILGNERELRRKLFIRNISSLPLSDFTDQRVVIKGCGDVEIEEFAYLEITKHLLPVAKTIMYGEPCSTVPIYKRK
jgi:hypothetical protein